MKGTAQAVSALQKFVAIFEFVTDTDKIPPETLAVFFLDTLRILIACDLREEGDKGDVQKILGRAFERDSITTELRIKHDPTLATLRDSLEALKAASSLSKPKV